MTDSLDRKSSPPMPDEVKERLRNLPAQRDVTDFADLPTWVRTACAMHEFMGYTWKEVAERLGKSKSTVDKYKRYTAYKLWREELQEAAEDPKVVAEAFLRASAMGVTVEYLAAFQKAVEVGDYDSTAKMAKDLLDRAGVVPKKSDKGGVIKLQLQLGSGAIEGPVIEADYTVEE